MHARSVVLALLLALSLPVAASAELPAPDAPGPWNVGIVSFEVVDPSRGDRTLTVDVLYPVDPEDTGGPQAIYDLVLAQLPSPLATADPPVADVGGFPLAVFSHGSGGIRFQTYTVTETLASHGFVVVAPDHTGNTTFSFLLPPVPFTPGDRPLDISFVIDEMLARNADPTSPFFESIDPDRIGVLGHSFGAFTSIAMAAGFEAEAVAPDPRVKAIAPIAPVSTSFTDAELAGVAVPTLVMGGTDDITTPIDPQSIRAFDFIGASPRYRVDVQQAGHQSFTNICDIEDALVAANVPPLVIDLVAGLADEGCVPELIPVEEALRITNLYVVSFFQTYVAGDERYWGLLAPGRASKEPVDHLQVRGGIGTSYFFGVFRPCFGSGVLANPSCAIADLDGDDFVGPSDFFSELLPALQ